MMRRLTALIEREGDGYVALCPELDIANQGDSIEQARESLREALEMFFEEASAEEIDRRFFGDMLVTGGIRRGCRPSDGVPPPCGPLRGAKRSRTARQPGRTRISRRARPIADRAAGFDRVAVTTRADSRTG
jgi:predicted RNase H-like HicB family nuclease